MTREQALNYMRSSGWSEEQINTVTEALTCEDAISRQAVLDLCESKDPNYAVIHFKEDVECLPSVSTEKTGRWISDAIQGEIDGQIVKAFICSECGAISIFRMTGGKIVNGDLCPNCGAKMVESQESEDEE